MAAAAAAAAATVLVAVARVAVGGGQSAWKWNIQQLLQPRSVFHVSENCFALVECSVLISSVEFLNNVLLMHPHVDF
jgi:hypothetical protein